MHELKVHHGNENTFHFLKSDTQSGEFFVLRGAKEYLAKDCIGLELELFRYPLYENLVTEDRVISYLDGLGFYPAGWTGYQNSFNSQADWLFLRKKPRSEQEVKMIDLITYVYNPKGPNNLIKQKSMPNSLLDNLKDKIKSIIYL